MFSPENVSRAWLLVKKLHPLIGAVMQERDDGSWVDFIIDENKLHTITSNEIVFTNTGSEEEACRLVDKTLNEDPQLSNQLLCQLWIVSQSQQNLPGRMVHHVVIHMRHSIMDGVGVYSTLRNFFDILTRRTVSAKYESLRIPLEEYLELHPPIDALNPSKKLSKPVQRWKKAIATVMYNQRILRLRVSNQSVFFNARLFESVRVVILYLKQASNMCPRTL